MSYQKDNAEWRDPTAEKAIGNVFKSKRIKQKEPVSLTSHKEVEPLSKFDDDSAWRGRRRLLRTLNRQLAEISKSDMKARAKILNEIRDLSRQQFTSRVTATEARRFAGRRSF